MTLTEIILLEMYKNSECAVMEEIIRLLGIGFNPSDIAVVMSRDVYSAAVENGSIGYTQETLSELYESYRGYDVFIINEDTDTTFRAVVKGGKYLDGMTAGDLIIAYGSSRLLYKLIQNNPLRFADIGLTVRAVKEIVPSGRVTFADRFLGNCKSKDSPRVSHHSFPELDEPSVNDTKELDDFLNSFTRK